jgi:hypothetical protein
MNEHNPWYDCVVISGDGHIIFDYFCQHSNSDEAENHAARLMLGSEHGHLVIVIRRPEVA